MSLPQSTTNAAGLVVGTVAATNPWWLDPSWLASTYQAIMAVGGLTVLILTLLKLCLDLWKGHFRDWNKPRNGPGEK